MTPGRAALVQLGSKIVNVAVQLGVTMVLARILTPTEYGVVAVLTVFTGFFSMISDLGISTAIVQFKDLTEEDYSRLLTFSFGVGVLFAGAFFLVSSGVSVVYANAIYVPLGGILTGAVLFNSLNMVPNGLLLKERRFGTIAVRLVVCTAVVGALTVVLALMGWGCYAIAVQSTLTALFVFLWNQLSTRTKPRLHGIHPVLRRVGKFSAFQFGHQFIGYFANNTDSLLVGRFLGAEQLGYYNKAYGLAGYPNNYLASSITSVLHPFLSQLQDDHDALYDKFVEMAKAVSIVTAWAMAVFVACGNELVLVMYGNQWTVAGPILQILSFAIYARAMNSCHGPLLLSCGRTDLLMRSTLINSIMTVTFICLGVWMGSITTTAIMITIAYNFELVVPVYICMRICLQRSILSYVRNFAHEIVAFLVSLAVGVVIPAFVDSVQVMLLVRGSAVTIVFLVVCLLLGEKDELVRLARIIRRNK